MAKQPFENKHSQGDPFFHDAGRDLVLWLTMHDLVEGRHLSLATVLNTLRLGDIALKDLLREASDKEEFFGGSYADMAAAMYSTAEQAPQQYQGIVGTLKRVLDKEEEARDFIDLVHCLINDDEND